MAKQQKADPTFSQEQPYDSSFKMLLEDQLLAFLSYLLGVIIVEAHELKEALFKQVQLKPSLRVDALYSVREAGSNTFYPVHLEFETEPVAQRIVERLIEYFGLLFAKHHELIVQVLVSPFKADNLPDPIVSLKHQGRERNRFEFQIVALSRCSAQELLERQLVEVYALMPLLVGATYERLMQALEAMEVFYKGQADRFRKHLMWFDAFLEGTTNVTAQDKERIRQEVGKQKSLLEEGFFYKQATKEAKAKGRQVGRQEGRQEGELEGLQEAIMAFIEIRFPGLVDLARQQLPSMTQREILNRFLKQVYAAPDETALRSLLEQPMTAS